MKVIEYMKYDHIWFIQHNKYILKFVALLKDLKFKNANNTFHLLLLRITNWPTLSMLMPLSEFITFYVFHWVCLSLVFSLAQMAWSQQEFITLEEMLLLSCGYKHPWVDPLGTTSRNDKISEIIKIMFLNFFIINVFIIIDLFFLMFIHCILEYMILNVHWNRKM